MRSKRESSALAPHSRTRRRSGGRYFKMSRLRLVSFSKSAKRIALSRRARAILAVEQLPVCSRITLGGAPHVILRLAKSLSFVRNVNPCAFAYSHMTASGVLPSSAELT